MTSAQRSLKTPFPPRSALARVAIVLAVYTVGRMLAASQVDPVGAAESGFLALLAGVALAAVAAMTPQRPWELYGAALLVPAALWLVGYGPHRGAVVTLLLTGALVLAVGRSSPLDLSASTTAAIAVGFQVLLRPDLLLPPLLDLRTIVSVVALPVAAGFSIHILAERFGRYPAMIAGTAVMILAPGFNVTTTLALTSLAACVVLESDESRWIKVVALVVLLVPPVWDPMLGILFSVGSLSLVLRGYATWLIPVVGTMVAFRGPIRYAGQDALYFWLGALALLPALLVVAREQRFLMIRGAFFAFLATLGAQGEEALASGLAMVAVSLPREGRITAFQTAFVQLLALLTTILATYPWLQEEPRARALELVGIHSLETFAVVGLLLVVGLGWLTERLSQTGRNFRWAPFAILWIVTAVGLLRGLPTTATVPIAFEAVTLSPAKPVFKRDLPRPGAQLRGGVLDSHLIYGAGLAWGTPVATVTVRDADQRVIDRWEVLAGIDTAEWAAARRDVADREDFRAPSPFLSHVAPGGEFFAQRFRTRFSLKEPQTVASISIRRHPELPPKTEFVIYRLELRR